MEILSATAFDPIGSLASSRECGGHLTRFHFRKYFLRFCVSPKLRLLVPSLKNKKHVLCFKSSVSSDKSGIMTGPGPAGLKLLSPVNLDKYLEEFLVAYPPYCSG